jgi:hypothetical protein
MAAVIGPSLLDLTGLLLRLHLPPDENAVGEKTDLYVFRGVARGIDLDEKIVALLVDLDGKITASGGVEVVEAPEEIVHLGEDRKDVRPGPTSKTSHDPYLLD